LFLVSIKPSSILVLAVESKPTNTYLNLPGTNVTKLFTAVINHHFTVIPSFCIIKLYYFRNYCGMAINYCGVLTLEKVGLELPQ